MQPFIEFVTGPLGGALPGHLYVVPARPKDLMLGYQSSWKGLPGSQYYPAGASGGGIPASLKFGFSTSDLARVTLQARAGTSQGSSGYFDIGPENACGAAPGFFEATPVAFPSSVTQDVTSGSRAAVLGPNDRNDDSSSLVRDYAAGRSYRDVFGSADLPPSLALFFPAQLFSDPLVSGAECCATVALTLREGRKIVKRSRFTGDQSNGRTFTGRVARPGWYSMYVAAWREKPKPTVTPSVLSSRIKLAWRFHITPIENQEPADAPVTLIRYQPRGLDMSNGAAPGAITAIGVYLIRAGSVGVPQPKYRLKTLRVHASFNDGKAWRALKVSKAGRSWVVSVTDPASGYVALRSTVIDVKGDSTVQTIYRAYGIR
jgi:hypothetical protein